VPDCLTFCPTGDMTVRVVVRDFASNPVAGALVQLDFSACPAFVHCDRVASDPYTYDDANRRVLRTADMNGVADFPVRMGGVCAAQTVKVFAGGVQIHLCSLASPDQDGDLVVNATDAGIIAGKNGSNDSTGDFDCDHVVSDLDVAVVGAHLRHACDLPTRLQHKSWGKLKMIYR
jgi:hypothetical protein